MPYLHFGGSNEKMEWKFGDKIDNNYEPNEKRSPKAQSVYCGSPMLGETVLCYSFLRFLDPNTYAKE